MLKLIPVAKKMIITITVLSIVALVIGTIIVDNKSQFAIGIIFGALFSLFKVVLMNLSTAKAITMAPLQARMFAIMQFYLRTILTGVVLFIAATNHQFSLVGTIIGVLFFNASAYVTKFWISKELQNTEGILQKDKKSL